jgi:hypothetical protein
MAHTNYGVLLSALAIGTPAARRAMSETAAPGTSAGQEQARARNKRLLNDLRLEILGELVPPACPGNHFQPPNLFPIKLIVKHRHRRTSKSKIVRIANHPLA